MAKGTGVWASRRRMTWRCIQAERVVPVMALALTAAFAVAGCLPSAPRVPKEPVGITGKITSMPVGASGVPYTMLVEGGKQPAQAVSDKAMVTVSAKTTVADSDGRRIAPGVLKVGMRVNVWFDGPVAESYPVQGGAKFIQVLR